MIIKKVFLALMLSLCFSQIMVAQSGMTDNQVMQFMVRENERGSSRSEIVTKLIERGVQIEQIRRVRDKVEKQKSGAVVGARNISGYDEKRQSRLRQNNSGKRGVETKGDGQRTTTTERVNESLMSPKQLKRYRRERDDDYMTEMDKILPDSIVDDDDYEYEYRKQTHKKQVFGRNIFNNRSLSFEPNMNIATPQDYRLGPVMLCILMFGVLRKDNSNRLFRPRVLSILKTMVLLTLMDSRWRKLTNAYALHWASVMRVRMFVLLLDKLRLLRLT